MHRLLSAVLLSSGVLGACVEAGLEHQLISGFFKLSRIRDMVSLTRVSTVAFDPLSDGVVQDFEVASVEAASDTTRKVTVNAQVDRGDGQNSQRTIVFTLQRVPEGRWVITAFKAGEP